MTDPQPHYPEPSASQIYATIAVLGDDPGPLQEAARRRLLAWGDVAVPHLQDAAESGRPLVRARCRAVLRTLDLRALLRDFGGLRLDQIGTASASNLLDGAVLAARMVRTFVPETRRLAAQLRREAGALRRDCSTRSLPTCARLLADRLHGQVGLQGCDAELLDVDSVLIDRVLKNGIGAPVSLSLIYLLVARWAGLSVAGVALPDHFLVRLHGPRPILVDPFHGGRTVTKADCARYLRANGYDRVREHLRDLTDREVLIHYLRCLRGAANRRPVAEAQRSLGQALSLLETS